MQKKYLILFFLILIVIALGVGGWFFYSYNLDDEKVILNVNNNVLTCEKNEDCIPDEPLVGAQYLYENNKCTKKSLGSPASTYCQKENGTLEERIDIRGGKYMVCIFNDNSECEEWKFFKEECSPGDFDHNDNVWEGKIIRLRGAVYDDYFEMLNGEKIGIDSTDSNIKDILIAIQDKNETIKISGEIEENVSDVGNKRLNAKEILDLGEITFKEVSQDESQEVALKAVEDSDDYIKDKGEKIELIETIKVNCPYCWTFRFYYFSKKAGEKILDVLMQEGEVKDISFVSEKKQKLYDCIEFAIVETCTSEHDPVCAKIQELIPGINESTKNMKWKDFSNACEACTYSGKTETVVGYKMGKCQN